MQHHNSPTIRTIFLGTPHFAAVILESLASTPYRPILVLTEPDKPVGRTQVFTPPAVKTAAYRLEIPVTQPANNAELAATIEAMQPDLLLVAAYGRLLRPTILEIPSFGCLNVHASLLPNYRGASPIQAVILAGDAETGVTIMQIDEGLDTGPTLAHKSILIEETDTTPTLTEKLAHLGSQLLLETLPGYLAGTIEPKAQTGSDNPVTHLLTKDDGQLTGLERPEKILRMLRAYTPWPGVWAEIDNSRILLHDAKIIDNKLVPTQVQVAGKTAVDWATFQRDRQKLADHFLAHINP